MIFNKILYCAEQILGLTHSSPDDFENVIRHFTFKMETFTVDSTVIFVTEVIFLGIYCTFLS